MAVIISSLEDFFCLVNTMYEFDAAKLTLQTVLRNGEKNFTLPFEYHYISIEFKVNQHVYENIFICLLV